METLQFRFENGRRSLLLPAQVVGVVGSGNLEVLIEAASLEGACCIEINTAAEGFGAIWQAVLNDFQQRWLLADVRIAINDMGATPAVVSLRLDQAVETMLQGQPRSAAPSSLDGAGDGSGPNAGPNSGPNSAPNSGPNSGPAS